MDRTPVDEHFEFKIPTNSDDISILFGRWLLHYFSPWNPGEDTWIDVEKRFYYTTELFELFKKEILSNE
jgi:hypothetical protein